MRWDHTRKRCRCAPPGGSRRKPDVRFRRCLHFQSCRAVAPHLPYPSSPLGGGGDKKRCFFFSLPPPPPGGGGGGGEGGAAAWRLSKERQQRDRRSSTISECPGA